VPIWGGEKAEQEAINESGITGYSLWSDKDAVEDAQSLVWTEKSPTGTEETVAQLKLRPDAMKQLQDTLKPLLPATATAYRPAAANVLQGLASDVYYSPLLGAVKTINYHAGDAAYNLQKVDEALALKPKLEKLALSGTADEQKMADQYLQIIDKIENAQLQKPSGKLSTIAQFNQYQPPPKAAPLPVVPKAGPQQWKATIEAPTFVEKFLKDGEAVQTTGSAYQRSDAQAILLDMGDVKARYIPGGAANEDLYALQGQLELRTEGEATAEVMERLANAFKELGIDVTPPTDDYRKSMYLIKNIYLVERSQLPAEVVAIIDAPLSDAERLQKIQDIINRSYPRFKLKKGDLRWQGEMVGGDGYRTFARADMTGEQISKEMPGYILTHSTGKSLPELLQKFFDSGGQITPTTERLRKGISLTKTGGMSPTTDLETGGASYLFTRIKQQSSAGQNEIVFDISHLDRLDAYSYADDVFGNVQDLNVMKTRAIAISQYKRYAASVNNETIFKNGFDVTEAKYFVVATEDQRQQALEVLRKNAVVKMADGRPIEQAVILSSQSF
jgi:hypothetical protein